MVWSESSLWALWAAKDPNLVQTGSEDSDQTGQMSRQIWFFAGHTCHFVYFVMPLFNMSRRMTKPTKWLVRLAKTKISLCVRTVWSESSLSAWQHLGPLATHWAHSEDSDQTGRMPRLIWVFTWRTCHFVGFVMRRLVSFCLAFELYLVAGADLNYDVVAQEVVGVTCTDTSGASATGTYILPIEDAVIMCQHLFKIWISVPWHVCKIEVHVYI